MSKHWFLTALLCWALANITSPTAIPIVSSTVSSTANAAELQISEAERQKINAAIPRVATATPQQPRKLLIFGLNVGYPGHGSIRYADYALTQMGKQTGAFESLVSNDPEMFRSDNLRQFDAVFFNNNVGNLFQDPKLRQSLVDFIYTGGGMLGVHGATVAFTRWPGAIEDWPEFGRMLGGRGANHKDNDEHVVIKLDDPTSPINQPFGGKCFEYRDEFFRVHERYSRNRLRVLLSIDTERTDLTQGGVPRGKVVRADNDYALAWIRNYGRGRVFYCTIAHNPYVFWDPTLLKFYLNAIQFALGDLRAPTTPSARLTPAIRAQERLGWHLELSPDARHGVPQSDAVTLFDTIDLAAQCKLSYIGASSAQHVSRNLAKTFDDNLSDDELLTIRERLDDAGVRLLTYSLAQIPGRDTDAMRTFNFARKMGVELVLIDKLSMPLPAVARAAQRCEMRVSSPSIPGVDHPQDKSLTEVQRRYVGHTFDLARWRSIDPNVLQKSQPYIPNRVFACKLSSTFGTTDNSPEDQRQLVRVLRLLAKERSDPLIFQIAYGAWTPDSQATLTPIIHFFNSSTLQVE